MDTDISRSDYQKILASAPDLYLILNANLTIVGASDAYLHAVMLKLEDMLHKNIFTVFPDNPHDIQATGKENLRSSLERVLKYKKPDTMAVQKYDIVHPDSPEKFEEHFWSPINTPVLGEDGNVKYIIHRVEEVTEYIKFKTNKNPNIDLTDELRKRNEKMESEIYLRAQEIQKANEQLRLANTELLEHQNIIQRQQKSIQALSTPILQLQDRLLMLPLIGEIDTKRAHQITDQLLHAIQKKRAKAVVIDITGVPAVDINTANYLIQTLAATRLMGAHLIISGLSSNVANTLVESGVDISKLVTKGDLQSGIQMAVELLSNM